MDCEPTLAMVKSVREFFDRRCAILREIDANSQERKGLLPALAALNLETRVLSASFTSLVRTLVKRRRLAFRHDVFGGGWWQSRRPKGAWAAVERRPHGFQRRPSGAA